MQSSGTIEFEAENLMTTLLSNHVLSCIEIHELTILGTFHSDTI